MLGLVVVYVDDFLITSPLGPMRDGLKEALKSIWSLSEEQVLAPVFPLRFLGLEMERTKTGIKVHQFTFINELLCKYCFDKCNRIQSVTMEAPVDEEPPDAD